MQSVISTTLVCSLVNVEHSDPYNRTGAGISLLYSILFLAFPINMRFIVKS
jgi:hypothetical protein